MAIFRLQNHTPENYVNPSRDFQLLCRLFDCINSGVRYEINSMKNVLSTEECMNNLLPLLQTKLGFFTKYSYDDEELRIILRGFVNMVKSKGTQKAIQEAINVYLRICGLDTVGEAVITQASHSISIGFMSRPRDTRILEEILKYIIPTGYFVEFYFYSKDKEKSKILHKDNVYGLNISNKYNSQIASINGTILSTGADIPPVGNSKLLANSVGVVNVYNKSEDQSATSVLSGTDINEE